MIDKKKIIYKKLIYKMNYSGSKELTHLFLKFIDKEFNNLTMDELLHTERLLELGDKIILDLILNVEFTLETIDLDLKNIINKIKKTISI